LVVCLEVGTLKAFTNAEAAIWIRSVGLDADAQQKAVSLSNDSGYVFTVRWPKILPYQVHHFANLFLPLEPTDSLFWLADNGASGAIGFELACRLLKLLRSAHGEHRGILESPAYLIGANEIVDARLLVTMAVLFCWDAYVVPAHGRYFFWIDDDEAADVCCKNKEDYNHQLARFTTWGLTPEIAPNTETRV
jgi:hypothetical protein